MSGSVIANLNQLNLEEEEEKKKEEETTTGSSSANYFESVKLQERKKVLVLLVLIILNQLNLFFKNETKTATTELPVLKSHLAHNDESDRNTLTDELGMININCCCT